VKALNRSADSYHTAIGDTALLGSMIPHHDGARAQAAWPSKLCATPGAGG